MVIYGIVGVLKLWSGDHLIVVTHRSRVCDTPKLYGEVWRIDQVAVLPFAASRGGGLSSPVDAATMLKEKAHIAEIQQLFKTDFLYCSYTRDLTRAQQFSTQQ